jgi:hypothetical protein
MELNGLAWSVHAEVFALGRNERTEYREKMKLICCWGNNFCAFYVFKIRNEKCQTGETMQNDWNINERTDKTVQLFCLLWRGTEDQMFLLGEKTKRRGNGIKRESESKTEDWNEVIGKTKKNEEKNGETEKITKKLMKWWISQGVLEEIQVKHSGDLESLHWLLVFGRVAWLVYGVAWLVYGVRSGGGETKITKKMVKWWNETGEVDYLRFIDWRNWRTACVETWTWNVLCICLVLWRAFSALG